MLESTQEGIKHSGTFRSNILTSIQHCSEHMSVDTTYQHARKRMLPFERTLDGRSVAGGGEIRKKQVILGRLNKWSSVSTNILFYTQHWPSLCLNLFGLDIASSVWIYSHEAIPRSVMPEFPPQISWISRGEASEVVARRNCDWIVLQGSACFIEEALSQVLAARRSSARVMCLVPSQRLRHKALLTKTLKKWYRIKHSDIGGVSSSQWLIGVSFVPQASCQSLPGKEWIRQLSTFGLARKFKDILKGTGGGIPVPAPMKPLPELVQLSTVREEMFIVPSYKSYSGWVKRELDFMELGSVFDASELTLKAMADDMEARTVFAMDSPPLKICHAMKVLLLSVMSSTPANPSSREAAPSRMLSPGSSSLVTPSSALAQIPNQSQDNGEEMNLLRRMDLSQDPHDAAAAYLLSYGDKAAKGEDARIPTELWDGHLFRHYFPTLAYEFNIHGKALQVLREKLMMRLMLRSSIQSFVRYLGESYGNDWLSFYLDNRKLHLGKFQQKKRKWTNIGEVGDGKKFHSLANDMTRGFESLTRLAGSSWWEWTAGSTLLFWRWPREIRKAARDGCEIFVRQKLPRWTRTQRLPKEQYMIEKMTKKFLKVRNKGYVAEGTVLSMINCFAVEKGDSDIRLVYDGTKSGLNECVWAPNFFLPSVDSMLMNMDVHTWCADLDLAEMFLNYPLHKNIVPYTGVDYTAILKSETSVWLRWQRMFMGFTPSPYVTGKLFGWTIDVIMGDRWDMKNPFRWDSIAENLPGMTTYVPSKPRLCRLSGENIAAALEAYVDDLRLLGCSELQCHAATSRSAKILQYLGQQNATRKYRPPHVKPGPWCGSFVAVRDDAVWVYTSQEKWEKAKSFISELHELLQKEEANLNTLIDYKFLERGRGFMIYFCRTYTSFVPYLKGLHLTMDSWRPGRDHDGWKEKKKLDRSELTKEELMEEMDLGRSGLENREPQDPLTMAQVRSRGNKEQAEHPNELQPANRLKHDVTAFMQLLSQDQAPWRFVRGGSVAVAHYGFGDASKSGFGSSISDAAGELWYRLGIWGTDESDQSSNYRELANLVQTLREYQVTRSLKGIELFLFTDNITAEAAFFKGSSKSRKLFELVLELRQLEITAACKINFIHVSGTRMIAQGTDGLSRGDLNEGVMKGDQLSSFIPLHLSALARQPDLRAWILSFVIPSNPREEIIFLDYEGWFERAHDIVGGEKNGDGVWMPRYTTSTYVWTPPPAATQIAVEQLRRARLKREASTHVVVVPRLMSPEWRKQLFKVADLCIELPFDKIWTKAEQHEPLTLAVVFPFLSHSPWQLKRTPAFLALGNVLRSLWKEGTISSGTLLHKLFCIQRGLSDLSPRLVRRMLQGPGQFGFLRTPGTERGESCVEEKGGRE